MLDLIQIAYWSGLSADDQKVALAHAWVYRLAARELDAVYGPLRLEPVNLDKK